MKRRRAAGLIAAFLSIACVTGIYADSDSPAIRSRVNVSFGETDRSKGSLGSIQRLPIARHPFTLADGIGLTYFGGPEAWTLDEVLGDGVVRFSPDRNYFAVRTDRGDLGRNRVEETLRFYRSEDVENFLATSDAAPRPVPVWVATVHGRSRIIAEWRWLSDSTGVAFLELTADGSRRLMIADVRKKMIEPLTSARERVGEFDIRDRQHYVYTAVNPVAERQNTERVDKEPSSVGTGRSLPELLFPNETRTYGLSEGRNRFTLWAVLAGERFEVKHDGDPIVPEEAMGRLYLSLSPAGTAVVTTSKVDMPQSWEGLYPPPYPSSPYRISAGKSASEYVLIDLRTGTVRTLTGAPTSSDGGWFTYVSPSWSSDGQAILLPGTFIRSKDGMPSQPCIAVVSLVLKAATCVERLKGNNETHLEEGFRARIKDARFEDSDELRVKILRDDSSSATAEYRRTGNGGWEVSERLKPVQPRELEVAVVQALDTSPRLLASNKQTSRVIWDPNPQLQTIELGQVSVRTWKDADGRDWRGGLYLPSDDMPGHRYPLVIQTHGFAESQFVPSGSYPTAFAARALAATGIAVLQIREPCPVATRNEGQCAVSGYEAAVNKLVAEGLIDSEKIGIIGFSRTCFYAMETLTTSSLHIKAASITDGQMATYLQYMIAVGFLDDVPPQFDTVIGARPFGTGLQQWLTRSPGFNLDKITAPLLVNAEGPLSLLSFMWEPYAGLRALRKPVDLIMLNTQEHVLTNPAVRMASQSGTVDWFRFWLQGYEDPDAVKAEQYRRWENLCDMQVEQNPHQPAFCVRSSTQ